MYYLEKIFEEEHSQKNSNYFPYPSHYSPNSFQDSILTCHVKKCVNLTSELLRVTFYSKELKALSLFYVFPYLIRYRYFLKQLYFLLIILVVNKRPLSCMPLFMVIWVITNYSILVFYKSYGKILLPHCIFTQYVIM